MSDPQTSSVVPIDATSNLSGTPVRMPVTPGALAPAAASLWVAGDSGPVVMRVDPKAGSVSGVFAASDVGTVDLQDMSITASSMWFPISARGQILQVGIPT